MVSRGWATAAVLLVLPGCASLLGRASAPDEHPELGLDTLEIADFGATPSGASVIVHVESSYRASLVQLGENGGVIGRCMAPCDRSMSLDGTYRIDGRDIRSSWPFRLVGRPGERLTLTIDARQRSTYASAKTLGAVGGVTASVGFAAALLGGFASTSSKDANGDSGAACSSCSVAAIGGAALMLVGIGVGTAGLAVGIANMSSGTSQSSSDSSPLLPSGPQPMWRSPNPVAAVPRSTTAPLFTVSF
jgi:hypothetical protein